MEASYFDSARLSVYSKNIGCGSENDFLKDILYRYFASQFRPAEADGGLRSVSPLAWASSVHYICIEYRMRFGNRRELVLERLPSPFTIFEEYRMRLG